mgnify:CR=1 FL=1
MARAAASAGPIVPAWPFTIMIRRAPMRMNASAISSITAVSVATLSVMPPATPAKKSSPPNGIAGATSAMQFAREEIFGPVAPVFRFETEAEAIRLANDTEYGPACYFYTRDLGRTFRVSEALQCGIVGVNEGIITTEVTPFGGVKESGLGSEGSKYGLQDYLDVKYTCIGGLGAGATA